MNQSNQYYRRIIYDQTSFCDHLRCVGGYFLSLKPRTERDRSSSRSLNGGSKT